MQFLVSKKDKDKAGVYRITNNANAKIYIGGTKNFYNRYHHHISDHKHNKNSSNAIMKAYKEIGIENFVFEIIKVCDKEDVIRWEQHYINKKSDYNLCKTAGSLKGYKHPAASKTKTIVRGAHHAAVAVDQYTIDGVKIGTFDCVSDARDAVGLVSKSGIIEAYNGRVYSAAGYRWARRGEALHARGKRVGGKKSVIIIKDNVKLKFESQALAAEYLRSLGFKCRQGSVHAAVSKKRKYKGYIIKSA